MTMSKFDIPSDPRFSQTEYVVDASHEECFNVWYRWSYIHGLEMEQDMRGHVVTIGHVDERPICVTVFWYVVAGYRVAFVEGSSELVDYKMVDNWQRAVFPCLRNNLYHNRHSNATNFGNIVSSIRGRRDAPMRDFHAVERALEAVPLESGAAMPRRMPWPDVDAIAAWVAGDGTDAVRIALADGIREGRR